MDEIVIQEPEENNVAVIYEINSVKSFPTGSLAAQRHMTVSWYILLGVEIDIFLEIVQILHNCYQPVGCKFVFILED